MQRDAEDEADRAESGRMRVRRVLIEPLCRLGLRRRPRISAEDHDAMLRRLEERFAYLDEPSLSVLCEGVERAAGGDARNLWPDEVSIRNWAEQLCRPPGGESRLVRSWLASAAGRAAWDEGQEVAVALRKYLRRHGRPPHDFDLVRIRREADAWRHKRAVIAERVDAGSAGQSDLDWERRFAEAVDLVRGLVFSGEEGAA
ncbi:hypothetical protein [Amaricoccus solimangrovi]|uniref:Uncharacterized protein n=1 Tax=Amaricoccus solimangrovi TaxID=2589815 RepID=A0A501WFV4_9RHOB|nr:hypothetical protein [Amaricoccus solimangrovi]TPE47240.1 hypothetical protein FJM51_20515 [Amaricoccus solimangrovi]